MVRPGTEEFLARVGELFEVVVFTASLAEYAEPLVKALDKTNAVSYLLFRQHCTPVNGIYVKDLSQLGRDLRNVILVDNSPNSFLLQPENAYHIKNFFDDKKDRELDKLEAFLENMVDIDDVRPIGELRRRYEAPPAPQRNMRVVKIQHEPIDFDNSSVNVIEPAKPITKKREDREKNYIVGTEPDLRKEEAENGFSKLHNLGSNNKVKARPHKTYRPALTERVAVNDRFLPQGLDSSLDIELPSPKESDGLINHRDAEALLDSNSNSTDSKESKKTRSKFVIPPFPKASLTIFTNLSKETHLVAMDDPTLEGQKVEEVRYHTGLDNLNSPLGKHVKIDLTNNLNSMVNTNDMDNTENMDNLDDSLQQTL